MAEINATTTTNNIISSPEFIERLSQGAIFFIVIALVGIMTYVVLRSYFDMTRSSNPIRELETLISSQNDRRPSVIKKRSTKFISNPYRDFGGVEIECINDHLSKNRFSNAVLRDYNFNAVDDYSLSEGGIEFRSHASQGDKLFKIIGRFCNSLKERKYYVDKSCGLHIHIEVNEKNLELIKKMYFFYEKYEDYFFDMVPKSRQDSSYCLRYKSSMKIDKKVLSETKDLNEFKQIFYNTRFPNAFSRDKYDKKRYCWVNFHSIFYRGTIEIRLHSGTIDAEKIKNWFRIHLTIINFLKSKNLQYVMSMSKDKKTFLSIFNRRLKKYMNQRMNKFQSGSATESSFQTILSTIRGENQNV